MIRKSGYRFSEKIMLKQKIEWGGLSKKGHPVEHDPEKWVPVFRKGHAQTYKQGGMIFEGKSSRA